MPFTNPVMGGKDIVRAVMQSPDFSIAGKTGWAIMRNGDAYFFNVTAEGTVTSNTVVVAGSGDGIFVYNGTPGPGTLVLAIASSSGTDSFGNAYSGPGMSLSWPGFANSIQIRPDKKAMLIYG
jgi:hypothetical protein